MPKPIKQREKTLSDFGISTTGEELFEEGFGHDETDNSEHFADLSSFTDDEEQEEF